MKRRSRNPLDEADRALWEQVVRSVRPLPGKASPVVDAKPESLRSSGESRNRLRPPPPPLPAPAESSRPQPDIERRRQRDLAKGRMRIDSRIDLHGMTQDSAFERLQTHLAAASARGERCVLVITGKGGRRFTQREEMPPEFRRRSDFDRGAGVLKRMVPLWLDSPALAPLVHAFAPAARHHGGGGALYVLLRRRSN